MKQVVMAMFDKAAGFYGQPFFTKSRSLGVRAFTDAINSSGEEPFAKHPDDFELYYLGEYDDQSASFSQPQFPELVCRGLDVKRA